MIELSISTISLTRESDASLRAAWLAFVEQINRAGIEVADPQDTYHRLSDGSLRVVITTNGGALSMQHTIPPGEWCDIASN